MERRFREVLQDVLTAEEKARIANRYRLKPGEDPVAALQQVLTQLQAQNKVQPTAEQAAKAKQNMKQLAGLRFLKEEYP